MRSGNTALTPEEDEELTTYLRPIVREIIKTAIENGQNLIVEGCYIPPRWAEDFEERYVKEIQCYCLVMTEAYIKAHFADIRAYANAAERRLDDSACTLEAVLADNKQYWDWCQLYGNTCLVIDKEYDVAADRLRL